MPFRSSAAGPFLCKGLVPLFITSGCWGILVQAAPLVSIVSETVQFSRARVSNASVGPSRPVSDVWWSDVLIRLCFLGRCAWLVWFVSEWCKILWLRWRLFQLLCRNRWWISMIWWWHQLAHCLSLPEFLPLARLGRSTSALLFRLLRGMSSLRFMPVRITLGA